MNVVKNMVHIWIGHKQPPTEWMETWVEKHPDWTYRVLTDEEYKDTDWVLKEHMTGYYKKQKYHGVADMIRYETLIKEGGFLPPADSVCLHPIDELLTEPSRFCYTVYENEKIRPNFISPIQASNPDNEFVKTVVEEIYKKDPALMCKSGPFIETGNKFLGMLTKAQDLKKLGVKIWPSHYLIPQHFKAAHRYNGPDTVYAEQMWGSTRGLYKESSC